MDFMNRNSQPQTSHSGSTFNTTAPAPASKPERHSAKERDGDGVSKWWRLGSVCLLFALTILVLASIFVVIFGGISGTDQSKYVKSDKYQAVFLTNGQVYFGNIKTIGKDYIQLDNIFYLTQNTQTDKSGNVTSNGNYTLVKLGCQQIHDPFDQMIISRDQVSFWENLQDGGKVVKSIQQFNSQNPNGPDCSQVSNQTQASSNTGTQGSSNTNNSTSTKSGQ
jgi:hypothetical protein